MALWTSVPVMNGFPLFSMIPQQQSYEWDQFTGRFFFLSSLSVQPLTVIQTLVSLRSRFMRCTLFSMAVGLVISVAQLAGNQPLSPSRILSP